MSADKEILYNVSFFVSFTASASFEAFIFTNHMRLWSDITESNNGDNGVVYHFEKMLLQDCSYIALMFDLTIEKMQGVINFG